MKKWMPGKISEPLRFLFPLPPPPFFFFSFLLYILIPFFYPNHIYWLVNCRYGRGAFLKMYVPVWQWRVDTWMETFSLSFPWWTIHYKNDMKEEEAVKEDRAYYLYLRKGDFLYFPCFYLLCQIMVIRYRSLKCQKLFKLKCCCV